MHTGKGRVIELVLEDGRRSARLACPGHLIPSPGQYLLGADAPDAVLPVPLFYTDSAPSGVAPAWRGTFGVAPVPDSWQPGQEFHLRGPLGRGFALPLAARRVALVAYDDAPSRLRGLIWPALKQDAAVVLVSDYASDTLPDEIEVQPLSALAEVCGWADYVALDVLRENLPGLRERLDAAPQLPALRGAQVLVRTPVVCGGMAECGVCAVTVKSDWMLACKEGPVFAWGELV